MNRISSCLLVALLLVPAGWQTASALGQRNQAALDAMEAFAAGRNGHVCWQTRRTGPLRIFCSDLDGDNLRQITPNVAGKDHIGPLISPDGTRVLYYQSRVPLSGANYYSDHKGDMMVVDITDTNGSSAERLVSNVRTYFECRFARWIDNDTIAYIAENHDGYLYSISGDSSSKLFDWPGSEFGAIPNRQLTYAIDGFNVVYQINNPGSNGTLTEMEDYNGCEGNMTWDGRFAYRVQGSTHHFMKMRLGSWWEEAFFDNHDSALPSGQGYIYFPQVSLDQKFLSLGASADEHSHFESDYDIFLVPIDPDSLEKTGPAVKYSFDNALDSYPDVWVQSGVAPALALSPGSLSFNAVEGGSDPSAKTVQVTNSGGGTLNNVSVSDNRAWLSVSRSGSGNSQTINHQVDISGLSAGNYNATVTVSCNNASNSPRTYAVQLTVAAPAPAMSLSPASLSFQAVEGGTNPSAKTVQVTNSGGQTLNNVSVSDNRAWLSVSRSGSGNSQTINHQVDISGLAAGNYNATVTVTCNNASNSPLTYNVQLTVTAPAPAMSLSPAGLSFQAVEGGTNPAAKTVQVTNSGGQTLNNVSVSDNRAWLSVSRSGSGNSQTINHQVDVSGLSAGNYNATVTVTCANAANSPQTYTVSLNVSEPGPALGLSASSLDFVATEGGPDPAPQALTVSNLGGGTLEAISAGEDAGWLGITRTGSGNAQVFTHTIDVDGLAAGSYEVTVTLSCANATNSPLSYSVHLLVNERMVLASIELTTSADSLLAGGSLDATARPLDQRGDPIPVAIAWSASGGGDMNPPASPGDVTEHTSVFQSNGTAGTYNLVASSGGVQASVTITVVETGLPLRINCGSNEFEVGGWAQDDLFVSGGKDWTNANEVDTSGVEGAAPPEVYRSVRHQTPHAYSFPVPDGDYLLKLHFADAYTDRSMDYYAEDQQILEAFDVASQAGGVNRALVLTFEVAVSDGDGLQIRAEGEGDVFEAGIELLEVTNEPPEVDAGPDVVAELGDAVDLDGTVSDAWVPAGTLSVAWTQVSGPGEVTFQDPTSEDTRVEIPAVGDYELQLWASDGMLEATDRVRVGVVEHGQPAITVASPADGEVWHPGDTEPIRWSTVNVDRVTVRYSTDDGATWTEMAASVEASEATWQDLPWRVPEELSATCRVRILDFTGRVHADSGLFEIAEIDGNDDELPDDDIVIRGGCACTGAGPRTGGGWLLLVVLGLLGMARKPW